MEAEVSFYIPSARNAHGSLVVLSLASSSIDMKIIQTSMKEQRMGGKNSICNLISSAQLF